MAGRSFLASEGVRSLLRMEGLDDCVCYTPPRSATPVRSQPADL